MFWVLMEAREGPRWSWQLPLSASRGQACVSLKGRVLNPFLGWPTGVLAREDLIVIVVHAQCRYRYFLQVRCEVGPQEQDHVVIADLCAPRHSLARPMVGDLLCQSRTINRNHEHLGLR